MQRFVLFVLCFEYIYEGFVILQRTALIFRHREYNVKYVSIPKYTEK